MVFKWVTSVCVYGMILVCYAIVCLSGICYVVRFCYRFYSLILFVIYVLVI